MDIINVKGYEFKAFNIRDSSYRRAVQFQNNIIATLKKLGINEDDVEVPLEKIVIRRVPASAEWYFDGSRLFFDYKLANKFIENLYVVSKVIEFEVAQVLNGEKNADQFIRDFSEDDDVEDQRKAARRLLGVDEDCLDLNEINAKYKSLAKSHHPDLGGSVENFKKINNAHKLLKRELS
jgi:hypothetical protein